MIEGGLPPPPAFNISKRIPPPAQADELDDDDMDGEEDAGDADFTTEMDDSTLSASLDTTTALPITEETDTSPPQAAVPLDPLSMHPLAIQIQDNFSQLYQFWQNGQHLQLLIVGVSLVMGLIFSAVTCCCNPAFSRFCCRWKNVVSQPLQVPTVTSTSGTYDVEASNNPPRSRFGGYEDIPLEQLPPMGERSQVNRDAPSSSSSEETVWCVGGAKPKKVHKQ